MWPAWTKMEFPKIVALTEEIALAEIDRVRASGVRFGCVLADAE
ncbi:hypothetical protein CP97_14796 [Aurantiacibacter atlanticus]|uniref:Uncharacterized protein n=1 Tax=Aurantiacibacter atlanticus TaxID=1648404 RepID=A0A161IA32_9SPHN|nr:hypothetical protein CP97_14796 [Aurantiacibacter atlanticus]